MEWWSDAEKAMPGELRATVEANDQPQTHAGANLFLIIAFPLTPALFRKEREQAGPSLNDNYPAIFAPRRAMFLPLPQGEGRGEGEVRGLKL